MISVSSHVISWLDANPTTRDMVAGGLINHSALARRIQSEIEQRLGEKVSIESITIALNRAGKKLESTKSTDPLSFIGDVSVQTGLTILNYEIADFDRLELPDAQTRQQGYFVSTRGIWHASIITTSEIAKDIVAHSAAAEQENDVTSITVRLKPGHFPIPGVCAGILSLLANKGVNFLEVISTHNELTILADQKNSESGMRTLMDTKKLH